MMHAHSSGLLHAAGVPPPLQYLTILQPGPNCVRCTGPAEKCWASNSNQWDLGMLSAVQVRAPLFARRRRMLESKAERKMVFEGKECAGRHLVKCKSVTARTVAAEDFARAGHDGGALPEQRDRCRTSERTGLGSAPRHI